MSGAYGPSGAFPSRHVRATAPPQLLPPSVVREASVLDDFHPVISSRFASDAHRPLSARTATTLTVNPHHEFAPLDTSNISFSHSTTGNISYSLKRSLAPRGPAKSAQHAQEPSSKRQKRKRGSRSTGNQSKPTFKMSQPVKNANEVYLDVWRLIFSFSSLKFLLEARTICKDFNQLLQEHQTIWKTCRELEFGPDMPSPPGQLTEQKYADLIVGKGCQSRACVKNQTAKVYWPFRVRLCGDCFKQKTVKRDELQDRVRNVDGRNLLDLLPGGISKSGKYHGSRRFDPITREWNSNANSVFYLRRDFDLLEDEYLQLLQDDEKKAGISNWVSEKLAEVVALMDHVQQIEKWAITLTDDSLRWQDQRMVFFQAKAASLSPPMSKEVLQTMVAYHQSISVNREPSLKAWKVLESKIVSFQVEAERLVELDRQMHFVDRAASSPQLEIFRRLHFHRAVRKHGPGILQPEQRFVIDIARDALLKCRERGVTDADLVLTCLQDVFDSYANIPQEYHPTGPNTDGLEGPYRLTLDDARMIVDDVIEPQVERHSQRGAVILQQFRCMACSRKDCTKRYSFQRGFEHILERHAKLIGKDHQYYKLFKPFPRLVGDSYFRFPWYTVEWPRCLPLVPGYFELTREHKWDPDSSIRYGLSELRNPQSAFEGRQAYDNPDVLQSDFIGNLTWAAEMLKKTRLDGTCQTRIALEYALERYAHFSMERPTLDLFAHSMRQIQAVNPVMDFRFRCAICCRNDKIHRSSKYVKHAVPWHDLRKHWDSRQWHKSFVENLGVFGETEGEDLLDWTTQMMMMPSDVEVWDCMMRADDKLRMAKEAVRLREEKRENVAKMRGDAKASVVLGMEEAVEVFGRLFVTSS
jgi:hypothetical protein